MNGELLKSCPFCGGTATSESRFEIDIYEWMEPIWVVECNCCGASIRIGELGTVEENSTPEFELFRRRLAEKFWNRRMETLSPKQTK